MASDSGRNVTMAQGAERRLLGHRRPAEAVLSQLWAAELPQVYGGAFFHGLALEHGQTGGAGQSGRALLTLANEAADHPRAAEPILAQYQPMKDGSCPLFARKFAAPAADSVLRLAQGYLSLEEVLDASAALDNNVTSNTRRLLQLPSWGPALE